MNPSIPSDNIDGLPQRWNRHWYEFQTGHYCKLVGCRSNLFAVLFLSYKFIGRGPLVLTVSRRIYLVRFRWKLTKSDRIIYWKQRWNRHWWEFQTGRSGSISGVRIVAIVIDRNLERKVVPRVYHYDDRQRSCWTETTAITKAIFLHSKTFGLTRISLTSMYL